jgi:hypothetical protein
MTRRFVIRGDDPACGSAESVRRQLVSRKDLVMTATTSTEFATTTQDNHRRTSAIVGLVSYAVGVVFTVPNAHDMGEIVVVLGGAALVAAVVFGWVVPRGMSKGAPAAAVTCSAVAALVLVPAFWSMLPLLLGLAGAMLGRACVGFAPKRGYAAIGIGALAVLGYLYLYLYVWLVMGDL